MIPDFGLNTPLADTRIIVPFATEQEALAAGFDYAYGHGESVIVFERVFGNQGVYGVVRETLR